MKYRILVVDDEPSMREMLGIMLFKEGYDVLEADSGPEALKQVRDQHPDFQRGRSRNWWR